MQINSIQLLTTVCGVHHTGFESTFSKYSIRMVIRIVDIFSLLLQIFALYPVYRQSIIDDLFTSINRLVGQKRSHSRGSSGLFPLHDMGIVTMPQSSGAGAGSSGGGAVEGGTGAPEQNIHMMSALLLQLVQSIFRFEPKSFLVMLGRELQSVEAAAAGPSAEHDPASQPQHSGGIIIALQNDVTVAFRRNNYIRVELTNSCRD